MVGLSWKQSRFTIGYDALKQLTPPEKQNRVSVVCSTTAQTAGQRQRLKFLAALKQRLGDDLMVFGKGFQQIDDKLEATLPYRYHLVLGEQPKPALLDRETHRRLSRLVVPALRRLPERG
jgi:hypothetical protein